MKRRNNFEAKTDLKQTREIQFLSSFFFVSLENISLPLASKFSAAVVENEKVSAMSTSQYTTLIHTSGHPALKPFPGFKVESPQGLSPLSPAAILALQQPSPPQASTPIYIETSSPHFSAHSPLMMEIKSEPMSSYSPSSSPNGPILSNGTLSGSSTPTRCRTFFLRRRTSGSLNKLECLSLAAISTLAY